VKGGGSLVRIFLTVFYRYFSVLQLHVALRSALAGQSVKPFRSTEKDDNTDEIFELDDAGVSSALHALRVPRAMVANIDRRDEVAGLLGVSLHQLELFLDSFSFVPV
jgi:hypothetical protein